MRWPLAGSDFRPGPEPRSGLALWVVALIATGMAAVVLAIVLAIAIPVFISQRAKSEWQSTRVTLPSSVAGLDRITGSTVDPLIKSMIAPPLEAKDIGVYGTLGPKVVLVMALKSPSAMTEAAQARERAGFLKGSTTGGLYLTLTRQKDAGGLGGWFGCAKAQAGITVCLATDEGSLFGAVVGPGITDPISLSLQAREATVTRP